MENETFKQWYLRTHPQSTAEGFLYKQLNKMWDMKQQEIDSLKKQIHSMRNHVNCCNIHNAKPDCAISCHAWSDCPCDQWKLKGE